MSPWRRLLFLEFTGKEGDKARKFIAEWDGYLGFSDGRDVTDFSEKYNVPAAIVKGKRAVVCPAWRRRRSPGPNLIQFTLCSRSLWDAIMGVCSCLSHPTEHSSCQLCSRAKPVSRLGIHSNKCS